MPQSYYELLGIDPRATDAEVRASFRARAKELHPDSNPGEKDAQHDRFVEVTEAYDVLKDSARRRQYDAARSAIPQQPPWSSTTGSYAASEDIRQGTPFGESEDAFDSAFKRWWERGGANWQQRAAEDPRAPNTAEYRQQQIEAWEAEKAEAQHNKARFERIRQRTKQARAARQAAVLRGAWQTRSGLVWVDAFVAAAAVAAGIGVAAFWAPILSSANEPCSCAGSPVESTEAAPGQQALDPPGPFMSDSNLNQAAIQKKVLHSGTGPTHDGSADNFSCEERKSPLSNANSIIRIMQL